jgi:hypothetical protein
VKYFILVPLIAVTAACSTPSDKAYPSPTSGPLASIEVALSSKDITHLFLYEKADKCEGRYIVPSPMNRTVIPAEKPLSFSLFIETGPRYCALTYTFVPQEKNIYTIKATHDNLKCYVHATKTTDLIATPESVELQKRSYKTGFASSSSFCD